METKDKISTDEQKARRAEKRAEQKRIQDDMAFTLRSLLHDAISRSNEIPKEG